MRIALTGGIACGKSLVAKFFNELGVQSLDADDVVHELEAPQGAAVPAIVARFGDSVLAPDGGIDRSKLAEIVFTGEARCCATAAETAAPHAGGSRCCATVSGQNAASRHDPLSGAAACSPLQALEAILHPLVRRRLLDFANGESQCDIRHSTSDDRQPLAANRQPPTTIFRLAIIPLLFESHFESDYDTILCVSSTEDRQIDRMMRTRGYTREQAEARLAAQMPVAEKAALADWTIHNDSTIEDLKAEVQRCVAWLSAKS